MDFLSPILDPIVESLLVPVKKHLGYLFSSTKLVRNMTSKMNQLDGTSHDIEKHLETNTVSNLEIPTRVPDWLKEAEKVKEDAERIISSNVNGCFNLKTRYQAGRKAFKTTQKIEALIKENTETSWSDAPKPLGKVSFKRASTSDGDIQNFFKSREKIFKEALGFLQQEHKAQVIALCGMGGVGKTTMMEQLKKSVEDKKMFDWVVKVVIGEKMNTFSIQQTMAEYLQIPLTETSTTTRAERLRVTFGKISQERKQKVLVILDDVWEKVELKDIGICPLPNGSKLLLTSRNENVCTQIVAEDDLDLRVVRVDVMEELEANNFFFQISKVSNLELKEMGVKIVKRCGFLPLAIKLIATNLRSKEKSAWKDTLSRLKKNDLDENVHRIIEISYDFITKRDAKAVFLLCGLFPDDFDIPIEDLTRYAWGLELLNEVTTLGEARDRIKTCVLDLKDASLLLSSDHSECVKMHDLVLAFVVAKVSKGDHPWIINHGDVSNWGSAKMSESCRRISLTCMGMSEFPRDFNYPNVSLLRLMNGDESLKFPKNFYEKMKNLQVMVCENLHYPLLPTSIQCSTTLRILCLRECSLMFDCSPIGDHLLNLQVLSFAYSGIRYLPSTIGKLEKLKLLDLTGCMDLRIHEGVLKNLVKLEELYMRVAHGKGVRFTDINYKELAECSRNLSAFDFEFIENNPHSKNMSYNKLERFKISIGRFLETHYSVKGMHSSENTLMFKVANKDELLESGTNVLFSKTEVLHLEVVGGMNNLEEVLPKSVPQQSSFYNLRVLRVSGCADLRYLFTVPVARGLVKLERLKIVKCPVMEALVYSEEEERVVDIRFQELKHLSLDDLPKLVGLSSNTNSIVIHLPQLLELYLRVLPNFTSIYPPGEYKSSIMSSGSSTINKPFFNKQAMIPPRLEKLFIRDMEALKNIWPSCEQVVDDATCCCSLQRIEVRGCEVMEALVYSEENIGEERVVDIRFQELKHLQLNDLPKLVGLSSNTNNIVIHLPQLLELVLWNLPNFTSIYPPGEYKSSIMSSGSSTINKPFFNKQAMIPPRLEELYIINMEALKNIWPPCEQVVDDSTCCCSLRYIDVKRCDNLVNMFPRNPMPLLHHLESILVESCNSIEVLFDIDVDDVGCIGEIKEGCGSKLRWIEVGDSGKLTEVWRLKGGGGNINHPDDDDVIICGYFQAVEKIEIRRCKSFRNIYTPTTARFDLGAVRKIRIHGDDGLKKNEEENNESVESNQEEEINDTSKGEIIQAVDNNSYVTHPFHLLPTFHHLQSVWLDNLTDVEVVFHIENTTLQPFHNLTTCDNQQPPIFSHLKELNLFNLEKMNCVWKCTSWNNHFLYSQKQRESPFHNLTTIFLRRCGKIKYLFSPLMAKHLFNLKKIDISECDGIEEVVSNRDDDDDIQTMAAASTSSRTNPTFFPHLDSLYLSSLSKLKLIHGGGARGNASEITSNVISNISIHENFKNSEVNVVSWSLCQYTRKIKITKCNALSIVIPFNVVGRLQQLQKLKITECKSMRKIFEIEGGSNNGCHGTHVDDESGDIITTPRLANMILLELPNLKILRINRCDLLEHIFTSSTLESLKQLEELTVQDCKAMKIIVKEDGEHTTSKSVIFPQLKLLTLTGLPNVKGFFFGKNEFRWPQLDKVKIFGCPQMMVFTSGHSTTPKLNYMHTGLGRHSLECGLNFPLTNASNKTQFHNSSICSTPDMIKLLQYPCSFSNLVEVDTNLHSQSSKSRVFFLHNELHKLQNLEKLNISRDKYSIVHILAEEVFEVVEETNDYMNETQSVVVFPKLEKVTLDNLEYVKHIWKSNRRIVLNFPNLTKVFINGCPLLGNVFTSCMVGSLLQLQELRISDCKNMEVVVKQVEDYDTRVNDVVAFPCLKSVTLLSLENLKGFYLGFEDVMWPSLDTLEIKDCPQITVFTSGQSTTPELKAIDTTFGLCYAAQDPTSFIKTKQQEGWQF